LDFLILLYIAGFVGVFISVYYLLNYSIFKETFNKKEIVEYPEVAILVPAFNEEENIKETIFSLASLEYPKNKLRIVVVDDGSKDKTFEKALEAAEEVKNKYKSLKVEVYKKKNGGKASALNFGIKKVMDKVKYIVCMDADSIVEPYSLKKMVETIENLPENYVACVSSMNVYRPKTVHQKFQALEYFLNNSIRKFFSNGNLLYVTPGPFSLYKANLFKEIGLFKEHITEDAELGIRIQANGKKIYYVEDSLVYTKTPDTFKKLLKQRLRWYLGGFDVQLMHFKSILKNNKFLLFTVFIPYWFYIFYSPIMVYYLTKDYFKEFYYFLKELFILKLDYFYILKAYFRNYDFHFDFFNFHVTYFYFIISLIFVLIYLYFAKKTIKKEDIDYFKIKKLKKLSFPLWIIGFILIYGFYFLIFYLAVFYYKIFGKELKFGNLSWKESVRNKLLEKLKILK
jgi:cellulose synthase/poly-beta-1,6-N-acetylglucosamine synthase-like glycosyltransferase